MIPYYQNSISCFVEDINPISKISKNFLDGSSGFVGPCLCQHFQKFEMSWNLWFSLCFRRFVSSLWIFIRRATTFYATISQGHRGKPNHLDHFRVVVHHFLRRPSGFLRRCCWVRQRAVNRQPGFRSATRRAGAWVHETFDFAGKTIQNATSLKKLNR